MGVVAEPAGCGLTGALRLGVIYYHCRDYRQASGAPVSLFTGYRVEQLETGQGMPKVYESRVVPGRPPVLLRRWRDATLSYKAETLPGEVYVMVGVFDNPEPFEPQTHARVTQKPEWLYIRDELPRYREEQTPVASRARCRRFPPEPRRVAGDLCDNIAAFLSEFKYLSRSSRGHDLYQSV